MLQQEINLYRSFEILRPAANFLTWKRYLYSQLFFLLFLCSMYVYSTIHVWYLEYKKNSMAAEVETLKKQFYTTKEHYPQLFFSQDVNQTINELEKQLESQKQLLKSLQSPLPFSQYLLTLSTSTVPKVWLTKIVITNDNKQMLLKGQSNSLAAVQQFIANLGQNKILSGYHLNVNNIESDEKNSQSGNTQFELTIAKKQS